MEIHQLYNLTSNRKPNDKKFNSCLFSYFLPVSVFALYNEYAGASALPHTRPWQVLDTSRQLVGCTATDSTVGA